MNKYQLKKLIKEVIQEVEKDIEEPSKSTEKDDEFGKHSREHEKQYGALGDVTVTLKLGGLKKNSSHIVKDFIAQAAWAAKMKDLEIINAEIEKNGQSVLSIDEPELKGMSQQEKDSAIDKELEDRPDISSVPPGEMPSREQWKKMSSEERDRFIKKGSHEAEWKAATEKDVQTARDNAKRRAEKLKAGTLETDPATGLPLDNTLWTDKEWEQSSTGKKPKIVTNKTGKNIGKPAYQPSFEKSTNISQANKKPFGLGTIDYRR